MATPTRQFVRNVFLWIQTKPRVRHWPPLVAVAITADVIRKMIRVILAAILLGVQYSFAIGIRVPEGWSQVEVPTMQVPNQMPPTVRPMIRLMPPGKAGTVSISEMKVLMSLDEATKTYVRGMPMRGITMETTTGVVLKGHEGKHIKGRLSFSQPPVTIPVEVYIIMTQECILSVEVQSTEASSMINEVLSWIEFQTGAISSKVPDKNATAGRSFWEYLGMGVVLFAAGYAIFSFKLHSKKKSKSSPG